MEISINSRITVLSATEDQLSKIKNDLTHDNPAYLSARRAGRWTGNTSRTITAWLETADGITLPRGYASKLPRPFDITEDLRSVSPACIPEMPEVTLRNYQAAALTSCHPHTQGVLIAPTGAGKSILGLALLAQVGQRSLILVHSKDLMDQWCNEIRSLMGIEAGRIGGGKWVEGELFTVAMIQTLSRNTERSEALSAAYGAALIDECHHVPASTFGAVVGHLRPKYRYGLSATVHREDGLGELIFQHLGPVIHEITKQDVHAENGLTPCTVHPTRTGYQLQTGDWSALVSELSNSHDRNIMIADIAHGQESPTLILVDRTNHAELLGELMPDALVVHGKLPPAVRSERMEMILNSQTPITIGTSGLLGEGLNCPYWSTLILASPISSQTKLLQAVGRVIRPHPSKKTAIVIDLVDDHPVTQSSFRKRSKIYTENDIGQAPIR